VAVVSLIDRHEGQTFVTVEAMPLAALDRGREVLLIRTPEVIEEEIPDAEDAVDGEGGE
jgi:cell shape-determining protein MreC